MTNVLGLNVFTATETPAIRPPPPTGIMTASTSLTCSIISRPIVPAPARIAGWSYLHFTRYNQYYLRTVRL